MDSEWKEPTPSPKPPQSPAPSPAAMLKAGVLTLRSLLPISASELRRMAASIFTNASDPTPASSSSSSSPTPTPSPYSGLSSPSMASSRRRPFASSTSSSSGGSLAWVPPPPEELRGVEETRKRSSSGPTVRSPQPIGNQPSQASNSKLSSSVDACEGTGRRRSATVVARNPQTRITLNETASGKQRPDDALYIGEEDPFDGLSGAMLDELNRSPGCSAKVLGQMAWGRGVPARVRHTLWMVLLGYLPEDPEARQAALERRSMEYESLVAAHYSPVMASVAGELTTTAGVAMSTLVEDDVVLLRQVEVDVARTHPAGATNLFALEWVSDMLKRILFVWSKTHADIGYFQGLNELPTPLIAVFVRARFGEYAFPADGIKSVSQADRMRIETDCFWCLSLIMDKLNMYCMTASSKLHAEHMIAKIDRVVQWANKPLADHLANRGVRIVQYGFRWVLCLMLREMPLRDALLVWDAAISDQQTTNGFVGFIPFVAASYLLQFGGLLQTMNGDTAMMFLHSPPFMWTEAGTKSIVADAVRLRQGYQAFVSKAQKLVEPLAPLSHSQSLSTLKSPKVSPVCVVASRNCQTPPAAPPQKSPPTASADTSPSTPMRSKSRSADALPIVSTPASPQPTAVSPEPQQTAATPKSPNLRTPSPRRNSRLLDEMMQQYQWL